MLQKNAHWQTLYLHEGKKILNAKTVKMEAKLIALKACFFHTGVAIAMTIESINRTKQ